MGSIYPATKSIAIYKNSNDELLLSFILNYSGLR